MHLCFRIWLSRFETSYTMSPPLYSSLKEHGHSSVQFFFYLFSNVDITSVVGQGTILTIGEVSWLLKESQKLFSAACRHNLQYIHFNKANVHTVWCHYNAVNFVTKWTYTEIKATTDTLATPTARPHGRAIGSLFLVKSLIYVTEKLYGILRYIDLRHSGTWI